MKRNARKGKRTLTIDNGVRGVKRKKKGKCNETNTDRLIDPLDSEKKTSSSRQQQLIERRKANQELRNQKNLRSNCFTVNQLLEENGKTCEEIGSQENPNEIFLSEDFDLDDNDETESNAAGSKNSGSIIKTEKPNKAPGNIDSGASSKSADEVDISNKFIGISKIIRIRCSACKISLENVDDNYLRHVRNCLSCQSPILFQCRWCTTFYKYFQSIWDHVERACRPKEINPSIRELALKASDQHPGHIYSSGEKTSDRTPTLITLDSDNEEEKSNDDFVNTTTILPIRIKSIESLCNVKEKSTDSQPVTDNTLPIRIKSIESLCNVKEKSTDSEPTANDTLPIRIQSIESLCNVKEKSADAQPVTIDINTKKVMPTNCPKREKNKSKARGKPIILSTSKKSKQDDHKCHICEFKAESDIELKNHLDNLHSENQSKNNYCTKCRKNVKSLRTHQQKCSGAKVFHYKCKFCEQNSEGLSLIKKHLIAKHSQLFKSDEIDGILTEIKMKRGAVREMFEKACEEKTIGEKELKNLTDVSKIENDVDDKISKLCKINDLLRIRCCKCKVTFEKVEEKIIIRCPDCQSELLYRCRLCDKLFAFFDEAWLHISYKCDLLNINKIDKTQFDQKIQVLKVPQINKIPQPTYNCSHCDYTSMHKWKISQHLEMWHTYANDDLKIKFTACSRCGLTFDNPGDCKAHEEFPCRKEVLLVCEFCPRAQKSIHAMRIHLVRAHSQMFGSIHHLENIINIIKAKRENTKALGAPPVPNQRDSLRVVEEV